MSDTHRDLVGCILIFTVDASAIASIFYGTPALIATAIALLLTVALVVCTGLGRRSRAHRGFHALCRFRRNPSSWSSSTVPEEVISREHLSASAPWLVPYLQSEAKADRPVLTRQMIAAHNTPAPAPFFAPVSDGLDTWLFGFATGVVFMCITGILTAFAATGL